jgi:CHASE2 domain-containing sensor protein
MGISAWKNPARKWSSSGLSLLAGVPIALAVVENILNALASEPSQPSKDTLCLLGVSNLLMIFAALLRSPKPSLSTSRIVAFGMLLGCALAFPIFAALTIFALMFM